MSVGPGGSILVVVSFFTATAGVDLLRQKNKRSFERIALAMILVSLGVAGVTFGLTGGS